MARAGHQSPHGVINIKQKQLMDCIPSPLNQKRIWSSPIWHLVPFSQLNTNCLLKTAHWCLVSARMNGWQTNQANGHRWKRLAGDMTVTHSALFLMGDCHVSWRGFPQRDVWSKMAFQKMPGTKASCKWFLLKRIKFPSHSVLDHFLISCCYYKYLLHRWLFFPTASITAYKPVLFL